MHMQVYVELEKTHMCSWTFCTYYIVIPSSLAKCPSRYSHRITNRTSWLKCMYNIKKIDLRFECAILTYNVQSCFFVWKFSK